MFSVDSFIEVLNESSSKGNQSKFYKDGVWVKLDNMKCSEGLAEEFVSLLEDCIYNFNHVSYKSDIVIYNDNKYLGCYSYNMYNSLDISFISCRQLFKRHQIPLNIFIQDEDTSINIVNVVNKLELLTGINTFSYFSSLIMLDCLIINEDRHYMNVGICRNVKNGEFLLAPCFDNGSSLFCTDWTYRNRKTLQENIDFAKSVARPFSKFYDKQLEAVLKLGAKPLVIDKSRLDWLLSNYYNNLYSDELNKRIKAVLLNRLEYYKGKAYILV